MRVYLDFEKPVAELEAKIEELHVLEQPDVVGRYLGSGDRADRGEAPGGCGISA
jgi:hypothetical protein